MIQPALLGGVPRRAPSRPQLRRRVRQQIRRREPIVIRLARINPFDKAGAYAIQEHGDFIVKKLSGSISNVMGLPVERLSEELTRWKRAP